MNKKFMILGALFTAVAVTFSSVSGTYAKYTSNSTMKSDTATVAKWDFDINGEDFSSFDYNVRFDLFKTAYELDTNDNVKVVFDGAGNIDPVASALETHMVEDSKKVAPGTGGFVKFEITNTGEVDAEYEVQLSDIENTNNIPLEYSGWNTNGTWVNGSTLANTKMTGTIGRGETKNIFIYWRWVFDGDDATDTNLGLAGTAKVNVTGSLILTQVD